MASSALTKTIVMCQHGENHAWAHTPHQPDARIQGPEELADTIEALSLMGDGTARIRVDFCEDNHWSGLTAAFAGVSVGTSFVKRPAFDSENETCLSGDLPQQVTSGETCSV